MNRRLRTGYDPHSTNAWIHGAAGIALIMLGLFGSAIADWWIPPEGDAGLDPAGETSLPWISDAPDPWEVEQVDVPGDPPEWETICQAFGTCTPEE